TEIDAVVYAGSHAEPLRVTRDVLDRTIVDRLLDVDARPGSAHLPLVVVDSARRRARGALHIGIGEDDVGRLTSELESQLLQIAGGGLDQELPDFRRTR